MSSRHHQAGTVAAPVPSAPVYTMTQKMVAEACGTFILVAAVVAVVRQQSATMYSALAIGLALSVALIAFSQDSTGVYNPVVAGVLFANGNLTAQETGCYILAEIVGGALALGFSYILAPEQQVAIST
jgi:glycerol uptake facilitator-like aquaporin